MYISLAHHRVVSFLLYFWILLNLKMTITASFLHCYRHMRERWTDLFMKIGMHHKQKTHCLPVVIDIMLYIKCWCRSQLFLMTDSDTKEQTREYKLLTFIILLFFSCWFARWLTSWCQKDKKYVQGVVTVFKWSWMTAISSQNLIPKHCHHFLICCCLKLSQWLGRLNFEQIFYASISILFSSYKDKNCSEWTRTDGHFQQDKILLEQKRGEKLNERWVIVSLFLVSLSVFSPPLSFSYCVFCCFIWSKGHR